MDRMHMLRSRRRVRELSGVDRRRGMVMVWILLLVPAIAVLIIMLTDLANIWQARIELKNALDAAALSAVKTWGEGGTTLQSRQSANTTFSNNTILGQTFNLSTAEGGCANNNVSSDGEILLGSVDDAVPGFEFDCTGTPTCFAGDIQVVFAVDTNPIPALDTSTAHTFTRSFSYRVESYTFTPPPGPPVTPPTLDSITIDLTTLVTIPAHTPGEQGFFDFRTPPPATDNQSGMDCSTVSVIPGSCPIATGYSTGGATIIGSNAVVNSTQQSLTVNFTSLDPGDTIGYGADTDYVGPDSGGMGTDVADHGDEFGSGYVSGGDSTTTGARITVVIAGSSFSGFLAAVPPAGSLRSEVTINGSFTNNGQAFGARARKTIKVNSIGSAWFGAFTQYDVTAEAFARFSCGGGPPQLIHVETFQCACP